MNIKNIHHVVLSAIIIGVAFIISAGVGSYSFLKARSFDNTLAVTGSAKVAVTSDLAKWTVSFSRRVYESTIPEGYRSIALDAGVIKKFLESNGITTPEFVFSQVSLEEIYKYGNDTGGPREYNIRQSVTVTSSDVEKIARVSKLSNTLAEKGLIANPYNPEYYYSKLADVRISLLSEAVTDARARAVAIAKSAKTSVGALKSATSGVTQVLAKNSTDVSDYGQYDTSTIDKEVMMTVRATFFVN